MAVTKKGEVELESTFYGEKTIIISKSGYGKSYATRVIIEEGLEKGHTFIILDPQDAYLNIKGFDYLNAEDVTSSKGLGVLLSQTNKNVIIRLKRLSISDQNKFLAIFLGEYRRNIRKGIQTIVIDEAHKYAPEYDFTEAKDHIRGMFQENRSDGLGIIAVTQRPQRIDKTCLSQADNMIIGKVTSLRDLEALRSFMDDKEVLEDIKKLKIGQFYFYGCNLDEPLIAKIRKAKSTHSGESPKNLLNEDVTTYQSRIRSVVKKKAQGEKMSEEISTSGETVNKIIPSMAGYKDLVGLGIKVSLGAAAGGLVGTYIGSKFRSPIPVLSSRSLGAGATSVLLYAGYRMMPNEMVKDVLKYSAAGSAAYTLGSVVYDILAATKINVPNIVSFALSTATGVSPVNVEGGRTATTGEKVDLNTEFQSD